MLSYKQKKLALKRYLKVLIKNTEILDNLYNKAKELNLDVECAYLSQMTSDNWRTIEFLAKRLDKMNKS